VKKEKLRVFISPLIFCDVLSTKSLTLIIKLCRSILVKTAVDFVCETYRLSEYFASLWTKSIARKIKVIFDGFVLKQLWVKKSSISSDAIFSL